MKTLMHTIAAVLLLTALFVARGTFRRFPEARAESEPDDSA